MGKLTIFFSHEWTSFAEPDPDGSQFRVMCSALREIANHEGRPLDEVYVWVDLSSLPQVWQDRRFLASAP